MVTREDLEALTRDELNEEYGVSYGLKADMVEEALELAAEEDAQDASDAEEPEPTPDEGEDQEEAQEAPESADGVLVRMRGAYEAVKDYLIDNDHVSEDEFNELKTYTVTIPQADFVALKNEHSQYVELVL